jgi:transcriptional regulator with XRE-family HTH domain
MQSIGKIIEDKLREKGISVSEFARRINTNRNNAYDIFRRDSIDTQLLQKISTVLEYDFFHHFIPNPNIVSEPLMPYPKDDLESDQKVIELEKEILYLKELINDKNRIIALLEEKIKEVQ